MALSYQKTNWVNNETKLNANNMNNIEEGVKKASDQIDEISKVIEPKNLFDASSDEMRVMGGWYYTSSVGNTLTVEKNEYTDYYTAVKIPVNNVSDITFSTELTETTFYGIYAVDKNMNVLKIAENSKQTILNNYTFSIPNETAYVCISISAYSQNQLNTIMCVEGTEPKPFAPYTELLELKTSGIIRIKSIVGVEGNKIKITAPEQYELVVGDTFELFYKGIVNVAKLDFVDVICTCSKGDAYTNKYVFTPKSTDIGTTVLTVSVYGINHNLLDTKTINLVVKAKATSPTTEKVVLCVGDSLTSGGDAPGEFKRRLTGTEGTPAGDELTNISFIGTCNSNNVDYEGYGGYMFGDYNTQSKSNAYMWVTATHTKTDNDQHSIYKDTNNVQWKLETIENGRIKIICVSSSGILPSTGTLTWVSGGSEHTNIVYSESEKASGNPFWNETSNKVDFKSYVSARGKSSLDYVYVLLGWNGAGLSESAYKKQVRIFLDNVLADFPNCKIILMGLEVPARDGLGLNYGANGIYANYYDLIQHVWNLNKWYSEIALESAYANNVSFINIAGQFDTEHNMNTSTRQVNTRNSNKETYQSNGIHPAQSGYYQIADACWRDFHHKLQS